MPVVSYMAWIWIYIQFKVHIFSGMYVPTICEVDVAVGYMLANICKNVGSIRPCCMSALWSVLLRIGQ